MKALSIRQPWAWLICRGFKDIENRTWHLRMPPLLNCPAKPMRIFIHASSSKADMTKNNLVWIMTRLKNNRQASELMLAYDRLDFGAIIGEVDIVGCVWKSDSPWFVGPFGFVMANPVLYSKPIPCKGKLRFFEPEIKHDH